MNKCAYGCDLEGIYKFKKKDGTIAYRCNRFASKCPVYRKNTSKQFEQININNPKTHIDISKYKLISIKPMPKIGITDKSTNKNIYNESVDNKKNIDIDENDIDWFDSINM